MASEWFRFDALSLAPADAGSLKGGDGVPLPPRAMAAWVYLVENRGRLVGNNELLNAGQRFFNQVILKNTIPPPAGHGRRC